MITDSTTFTKDCALVAKFQSLGSQFVLNPGRVTMWSGYRLLGYYCLGSSISPNSFKWNGKTCYISQLIASDNWNEEYQCGLYCRNIPRNVMLTIPNFGSFTMTYRASYRYHSFSVADCRRVYQYFYSRQNQNITIRLSVL